MSAWTKKELEDMLEAVVNELNLSSETIAEHGPLGTPPHVLVSRVLREKDVQISRMQAILVSNGLGTYLEGGRFIMYMQRAKGKL